MPRTDGSAPGSDAAQAVEGKRFSQLIKPAEKPKRPAKYRPMGRISLAWEPDFAHGFPILSAPWRHIIPQITPLRPQP